MSDFLDIEWAGLDELEKEFDKMEDKFMDVLIEEYTRYGMTVEEAMKALIPYDEGELADKSSFDPAETTRDGVKVEGGSSAKYALRRHEAPYRKGAYPKYDNGAKIDDYYKDGRGLGTRQKPAYRGYLPGRKFLENAIKATEPEYEKMLQRILDRTLGDKR